MASRIIVLDTEVFVRIKCNFTHPQVKQLLDLPKSEVYGLAITDITEREIKSKICAQINDYFSSASRLQKDVLCHKAFGLFNLEDKELEVAEAINKAYKEYNAFKNKTNLQVIPTNNVGTAEVMDLYFNLLPPFSQKKKNEFPDAVSLLAIHKKLSLDDAIIISGDNDWLNFFKDKGSYSFFKSIPEFVDSILTKENLLLIAFKEQVNDEIDRIKELIFERLADYQLTVYINGRAIQLHVDNIESIRINMFNIVNIEKYQYGAKLAHSFKRCDVDFDLSLLVKIRVDTSNEMEIDNISRNISFENFELNSTVFLSFDVTEYENNPLLTGLHFEGMSPNTWYIKI